MTTTLRNQGQRTFKIGSADLPPGRSLALESKQAQMLAETYCGELVLEGAAPATPASPAPSAASDARETGAGSTAQEPVQQRSGRRR